MNGSRARETVQKLWNASKSLQGGGVSYYEYVTELTYLLLLKMLAEVKKKSGPDEKAIALEMQLPEDCRWSALKKREGEQRLQFYRKLLVKLGDRKEVKFELVNQVFADAKTSLTKPTALTSLITTIDKIDWYAAEEDGLGDLYEGLLEKTTSERNLRRGNTSLPVF